MSNFVGKRFPESVQQYILFFRSQKKSICRGEIKICLLLGKIFFFLVSSGPKLAVTI